MVFISQPGFLPNNTIVWETIGNPDSMDPAVDNERFGNWVLSNIYETLYTYPFNSSSTLPLIPLLATSEPLVSPDGKNYTIEVQHNVTFHDGMPFNASCVKWNIERAMKIFAEGSAIGPIADVLKGGTQVKEAALTNGTDSAEFAAAFDSWITTSGAITIIDTYTVRFVLDQAFSPFLSLLATEATYFMSPTFAFLHATNQDWATWEAYGVDYGENDNYMTEHTCGTGPYTLTNWVADQYIELERYDDYWRTTETTSEIALPSYAGSIERVFIRTNEDTEGRTLNLRTGIVDGVYWPIVNAYEVWNPSDETVLYPGITVSTGGYEFATTFFGFNMDNLTITINSTTMSIESPFRNKHFRKCASFAFNYSGFIDEGYNGFGVQGKGPIPLGMNGQNSSSFKCDFNITRAVEEWNLAMQDPEFLSLLNTMNGLLTFYYIAGSSLRPIAMDNFQQGLEAVFLHPMANHTGLEYDFTINVEGLAFPDYIQYSAEGRLPIMTYGWIPDYADPISYLHPLCYSKGELAQEIGYNNTAIDLWINLAISENDPILRQEYFNHIQDVIADEAPYLWACQQIEFRTWNNWTTGDGLIFNPERDIYFYHINKDRQRINIQYPVLGFLPSSGLILSLAIYIIASFFLSPSPFRMKIKLALLVVYTVSTLYLTMWWFFSQYFWPGLYLLPGLFWILWCFVYNDFKYERDLVYSTNSTTDFG